MSAGVSASISQISAVYSEKKQFTNLRKTIKTVAFFNFLWGILVAILVFVFAPYIGEYGIKDIRTINSIKVTCPAMIFIALSNILKGYFWGTSKIVFPASIDILEKALRILTVAILIFAFKKFLWYYKANRIQNKNLRLSLFQKTIIPFISAKD